MNIEKNAFIGYESEAELKPAMELARQFGLIIDNQILPRLSVTSEQLVLLTEKFKPFSVDFTSNKWQKRRDAGKMQGLVRACKPQKDMRIIDATAGWGRDSAILASFGAQVLMLERQPFMAALLQDALERLAILEESSISLSLLFTEANQYLQQLQEADFPDLIYIDPMHPTRQKNALVKKDMQVLQQILGPDEDAYELLTLAMQRTRNKVVLKWPQRQKPLDKPHMSIPGKTVRFDIYLRK